VNDEQPQRAATATVYVDDARIEWRGLRWSHMVAESAEDLHAAARALGLPAAAAQAAGRTLHYDLPDALREQAIALGVAQPIHWRDLVRRRDALAAGRRRARPRAPTAG
jgi:hypothetical protein